MTLKKGMNGLHVQGLQELLHIYPDGKFGPLTEEAVKEFQKAHGLVADGIVGEKTWAALKAAEKGELKKSTTRLSCIARLLLKVRTTRLTPFASGIFSGVFRI